MLVSEIKLNETSSQQMLECTVCETQISQYMIDCYPCYAGFVWAILYLLSFGAV